VFCSVEEEWKSFLTDGEIPNYDPVQRSKNGVEATSSYLNANIFVSVPRSKTVRVVLLRIGNNADGEVSKASLMLNDGCDPPQQQSLRSAIAELNEALRPIVKEIINNKNNNNNNNSRLTAVMKWVDMEHLKINDYQDTEHKISTGPTVEETPTISTCKTKEEVLYPSLARYGLLEMINRSSDDTGGVVQREAMMNGILTDILKYQEENEGSCRIDAWSKGSSIKLAKVRPCKKGEDFYKVATRTGWIEDMLEKCIDPSNDDDDAVDSMIDYLLRRHEDKTRNALVEAGVIPSILDPFEVAALMDKANLGVSQWREVVKCLKTFQGLKTISVT
jgi:hypothetical protein